MTFISMATGTDTYVDKDTRRGMLLDKYMKTFQSESLLLLIESDDVMDPEVLNYIDRPEADISKERSVKGASGIADMIKSRNGGVLPGRVPVRSAGSGKGYPVIFSRSMSRRRP